MGAATTTRISPRARRTLHRLGVDIAAVVPSEASGRVVEADVLRAARTGGAASEPSAMRRAIARSTIAAWQAPHIRLRTEIEVGALMALRAEVADAAQRAGAPRPTVSDFLLRALALALAEHPPANRVWRDERLHAIGAANVGLVVAAGDGLLIPVLSPQPTLAATAERRRRAVAEAQAGRAAGAPCALSLSNLGAGVVDDFDAVIPQGQTAILAVGRASPRPWAVGDALAVRTTLRCSLSADHRVLDGQPAAAFLGSICAALADPRRLL